MTSVLSEALPIMLETIMTAKIFNITLQAKQTCIIIGNIQKPAKVIGVDIQTLRNGLGNDLVPSRNSSDDVQHKCNWKTM
jgi:hypothetical protein